MSNAKGLNEDSSRIGLAEYAAGSNRSKTGPQYLAAILATLGAFSAGTFFGWSSPALPLLAHGNDTSSLQITPDQASWVGSLVTLGAFAGAIPAGLIANLIGRKRTLQALAIPAFISWIIIACSGSVYGLYLGRILCGLAAGAFSVAIPLYVAELSESKIRGTLGTLFQLQITAGILFEYTLGVSGNLKVIALAPAIVPIIFLIAFSFMPESPVFLSNKGRFSDAKAALQWFRGSEYDTEDEITRIQDHIREEQANKVKIVDIVRACRGFIIALGLMVFQQLSGINAVIFYTENIFDEYGSLMPSYAPSIIVGAVMVVATYVSTVLIDRAGRRILLLISSSVMAVCLGVLGLCFILKKNMEVPVVVPLFSVAIYITVFSLGFGPIPWMMLGELFSPKMKGAASSISAAFNWLLAFSVTKLFKDMTVAFGPGATFEIFAAICVIGTVFVFFLVPETKGKDIQDILVMLGGGESDTSTQSEASDDIVVIDIKK